MKLKWIFFIALLVLGFSSISVFAQDVSVGGHLKMFFADFAKGTYTNIPWFQSEIKHEGERSMGMGFSEFILYVSAQLSSKISIDLQPYVDAQTGATPQFDALTSATQDFYEDDFWGKTNQNIKPEFAGFRKAAMTVLLPQQVELSAGILRPRFTWDYGAELYWEEEYHGGQFSNSLFLGAMHDTGIELYRNFDIGSISVPAYFYMLNGGNHNSTEYFDNNNSMSAMIHVEPEFGPFRCQLSALYGNHDEDDRLKVQRFSGGFAYSWMNLDLRGEAAYGKWNEAFRVNGEIKDAITKGGYFKAKYRIAPFLSMMYHYDLVDKNFDGYHFSYGGFGEENITHTVAIQLFAAETSIIQIQYDMADWKLKKDSDFSLQRDYLKFNRFVIGWRTTF